MNFNEKKLQEGVRLLLAGLGLDKTDDCSLTPERMARALKELCGGVGVDLDELVFKEGLFPVANKLLRIPTKFFNISSRGICPHHLLPILYKTDVTYKPRKLVLGLSRVHRLVRILSSRPVLQEQLAFDIAHELRERLECPVEVRLEGLHMCMIARGSKTELDSPVVSELTLE